MGLGHFGGGAAAARWLAAQGAIVTVTDLADERTLAAALQSLAAAKIATFHLGGHREEDFRQADLVVVNPAVRPHPLRSDETAARLIPAGSSLVPVTLQPAHPEIILPLGHIAAWG